MFTNRFKQLRKILNQQGIDSFLVSNFYNILYLSDFQTLSPGEREAFLIITRNKVYLLSDGRYITKNPNSKIQIPNIEYKLIESERNLITHLQEIIEENNLRALGFEAEDLLYSEYQGLAKNLKVQLIPTHKLIIKIREIKDFEEIEKIKKACEITNHCLTEIIKTIKLGTTEKEIAFKIELYLKEKNLDAAFYPIVAIDKNSAVPHYNVKEGDGRVKKDSIILIDMGAKYKNYSSDITRMIFFGKPDQEIINVYHKLLFSQEKTIEKIKNTLGPKMIDKFCRRSMVDQGLPEYPHSTGHGVGLEIHEFPKISKTSSDTITDNQIFTVEPGVYFPDRYGMRIEDLIWQKENGDFEILTKFNKGLTVIANAVKQSR